MKHLDSGKIQIPIQLSTPPYTSRHLLRPQGSLISSASCRRVEAVMDSVCAEGGGRSTTTRVIRARPEQTSRPRVDGRWAHSTRVWWLTRRLDETACTSGAGVLGEWFFGIRAMSSNS